MKEPLTNEHGEVRELTDEDFEQMRSMEEVLPSEFQRIIPRAKPRR